MLWGLGQPWRLAYVSPPPAASPPCSHSDGIATGLPISVHLRRPLGQGLVCVPRAWPRGGLSPPEQTVCCLLGATALEHLPVGLRQPDRGRRPRVWAQSRAWAGWRGDGRLSAWLPRPGGGVDGHRVVGRLEARGPPVCRSRADKEVEEALHTSTGVAVATLTAGQDGQVGPLGMWNTHYPHPLARLDGPQGLQCDLCNHGQGPAWLGLPPAGAIPSQLTHPSEKQRGPGASAQPSRGVRVSTQARPVPWGGPVTGL